MYSHSCVVATVVVNLSVLRDHGFHPRWKKWKEVSVLWDFSIEQKGCCSTGVEGEESELNMSAVHFYSQLLTSLCNSRELGSGSPHRGCELLRTGGNSTGQSSKREGHQCLSGTEGKDSFSFVCLMTVPSIYHKFIFKVHFQKLTIKIWLLLVDIYKNE